MGRTWREGRTARHGRQREERGRLVSSFRFLRPDPCQRAATPVIQPSSSFPRSPGSLTSSSFVNYMVRALIHLLEEVHYSSHAALECIDNADSLSNTHFEESWCSGSVSRASALLVPTFYWPTRRPRARCFTHSRLEMWLLHCGPNPIRV